ncbi:MAG: DUF4350 domain-containing protein [Candidatus Obscuribacterales bacterium]|nr:DUF4350 domain-containing protein [Candidatus Obscuribacterales bacterium]
MASKSLTNQIWLQMAIFILVSTTAALVSVHFKEKVSLLAPEVTINPSVLNKKASGSSAIYELTKIAGLNTHVWKLPYRDLKSIKGQLVMISPNHSLEKFERDLILDWVSKGNSLIYLDQFSNPYSKEVLGTFNIWTHSNKKQIDVAALPEPNLRVTRFVGPTKVSYLESFDTGRHLVPVLRNDKDILMVELRHGKGNILLGTTANLVANSRLLDSGANFQLIANWLRLNNSTVYFDERCHGLMQSRNLITSVLSGVSGILFLQIVVILAIAIAGSAQRFGQKLTLANARKISNLEFVNGIANSYRRARATHLAADVLSHNLRLKLAKALGQSTGDDETLAAVYANSLKESTGDIREAERTRLIEILAASKTSGNKTHISNQEMTDIAAYCDKIQETLETTQQGNVHDTTIS